jgi:hypothetical protein
MFFSDDRKHFFRPLNSKYREQIVECLRELYARLYSSVADYRRTLNREQLIEIFQEALVRAPLLDEDGGNEFTAPTRNEREQANWILNQLLEYSWLEKLVDEATLQSSYAFTRVGRLFTQPMVETAGGRFRTRHRNTRNTRNALQSFLDKGEVYDLLDAFEYSERIISDFSDVIAELDERKRQLVQEVEAQQIVQRASDEFFDFMEKRFMPDLAVRLSADSVEKYRDEIQTLINNARRKRKEFKADAERELRKVAPELITDPKRSLYLTVLDGIESRMHSAAETMLPALRHALNSFTRRADIIIRQLSYSTAGHQNKLLEICQQLAELPPEEQAQRLEAAGEVLSSLNVALVDPSALRLHTGRVQRIVNTAVETHGEVDRESRKNLFVQQAVESAFAVNSQAQRDYVVAALSGGHRLRSQNLPVHDAKQLLMSAHVIELGAAGGSSEYRFQIEATGQQVHTDYFDVCDEFLIELKEKDDAE